MPARCWILLLLLPALSGGCMMADPFEHAALHGQPTPPEMPPPNGEPGEPAQDTPTENDWPEFAVAALRDNLRALRAQRWRIEVSVYAGGAPCGTVALRLAPDEQGGLRLSERYAQTRSDQSTASESDCFALARTAAELALAYTIPQMAPLQRCVEDGAQDSMPGERAYTLTGFLMPDDQVVLRLAPATGLPRSMRFEATTDEGPVTGETTFRDLPGGPAYPSRTRASFPGRDAVATIQQFPQPL